jgi:hypothetical protein
MRTQPALEDARRMLVRDLIALPPEHLARLRREARAASETAARLERWLDGITRIKGEASWR